MRLDTGSSLVWIQETAESVNKHTMRYLYTRPDLKTRQIGCLKRTQATVQSPAEPRQGRRPFNIRQRPKRHEMQDHTADEPHQVERL